MRLINALFIVLKIMKHPIDLNKLCKQFLLHTFQVLITGDEEKPLPHYLQVFAHPMGEVYRFPEPDVDKSGKFGEYILSKISLVVQNEGAHFVSVILKWQHHIV